MIRLRLLESDRSQGDRLGAHVNMPTSSDQTKDTTPKFDYDVAMRQVRYVAVLGVVVILIYSGSTAWTDAGHFAGVFSMGLMAAGAALVSGGLLGFLFGVPHVREGEAARTQSPGRDDSADSEPEGVTSDPRISYRPSTSLEQISDWLTKMIVGVGLVEVKVIPDKLKNLASFVAKGLGHNDEAQVFALTLIVFFSICGFVFGYLWARLYLKRWFDQADQIRALGKKLDQLEMDARALTLVTRKLASGEYDAAGDPKLIEEAVRTASPNTRAQIFAQAESASENAGNTGNRMKLKTAISVFTGLIKCDQEQQYDRNHQELADALRRLNSRDLKEALKEITKAIDIRNTQGRDDWQYYEFLRARLRIIQDHHDNKDQPSDEALVKQILDDLHVASTDTTDETRWPEWSQYPDVVNWMNLNGIDVSTLDRRK
jgi:hypothetical protein